MSLHNQPEKRAAAAVKTPAPEAPVAGGAPTPGAKLTRCLRTSDAALGLTVYMDERALCFPYSHFLYADMPSSTTLIIRFATHRITVNGRYLLVALEDLATQRLDGVKILPKRFAPSGASEDPWIESIEVEKLDDEDAEEEAEESHSDAP